MLPKRDTNLELSSEEKDPRFTWLKLGLALRLLSKGLCYIRAMENINVPLKSIYSIVHGKAWLGQGRASQHLLLRSHFPFWGHSESPSGTVEVE